MIKNYKRLFCVLIMVASLIMTLPFICPAENQKPEQKSVEEDKITGEIDLCVLSTYAKYDSNSLPTTDKYNNFHDGTVSVSLPIAVYKTLSVTPTVSYVFPLCNDAWYEMQGRGLQGVTNPTDRNSSYLYGGVTLSYAF